jgi:hypothetical protein
LYAQIACSDVGETIFHAERLQRSVIRASTARNCPDCSPLS